ncbi:MAG: hypothetical protein Q9160_007181 [Pyrenula sp. 1 TL-2023]
MADLVWKELMPSGQISPDIECYAHYMEAHCWAGSWMKHEQFNFRITDYNVSQREKGGSKGFKNYSIGEPNGLKRQMTSLFNEMANAGLQGNEAVFTNLIVSMGREGDLDGVKSILKSVWNIDVDLLQTVDEEEIETPSQYEADSPLRPSSRLLFTLAHVFGINNEILLGLGLVDFVSRQYNLPIPQEIWFRILGFAYANTTVASGNRRKYGAAVGELPLSTFEDLWAVCTDEPHKIKPDISMNIFRSTRLRDRFQYAQAIKIFEGCKDELFDIRESLYASIDDLLAISFDVCQQSPELEPPTSSDCYSDLNTNIISDPAGAARGSESSDPPRQGPGLSQELDRHTEESNSAANKAKDFAFYEANKNLDKHSQIPFTSSDFILPARWLDARRKFLTYSLHFERDLQSLIVFARRMFSMKYCPQAARPTFQRRYFPRLIEQFEEFLPGIIRIEPVNQTQTSEDHMPSFAELHLEESRWSALLKNWMSERWGANLRHVLFTETNARLRNLCHVDSHDELMTVCQMLRPGLLHDFTWGRGKQMPKLVKTYWQSFRKISLDLEEAKLTSRKAVARRVIQHKAHNRQSFKKTSLDLDEAKSTTREDVGRHVIQRKAHRRIVEPIFRKVGNAIVGPTQSYAQPQEVRTRSRFQQTNDRVRLSRQGNLSNSKQSLDSDDIQILEQATPRAPSQVLDPRPSQMNRPSSSAQKDNDSAASNPTASLKKGRQTKKSKSTKPRLESDDFLFLEQVMSRAASQTLKLKVAPTDSPLSPRQNDNDFAAIKQEASSPRRNLSLPEQLSEIYSSFFNASDGKDASSDKSPGQQAHDERESSKKDNT